MSESEVYPGLGINPQDRQIRLIELLPGSGQDTMSCKFHTAFLDDKPTYEALSYVWGDALVTKTIFLDNLPFGVTVNLYSALQHLRQEAGSRMLWIDALRINQTDSEEKTHQINIMRDIYRSSRNGLIWLGDFVSLGLDLQKAVAARDLFESFPKVLTSDKHVTELPCFQDPSRHEKVFESISLLMESPWWTRIWTVQEIILPPKSVLIWGTVSISWAIFEAASDSLLPHNLSCCNKVIPGHFWVGLNNFMNKVIIIQQVRHPGTAPLSKLWRCRLKTATDARDKILGIMGLCPTLSLGIAGDSYYNVDAVTLFQQATAALIQLEGSLKPLIGLRSEPPRLTTKASWAIDWTIPITPETPYGLAFWTHFTRHNTYSADQNRSLVMLSRASEGIIQLKGLRADEVIAVGPALLTSQQQWLSSAYLLATIRKWREMSFEYRPHNSKYFTGEYWEEAFFRTLVGNMMTKGEGGGLPNRWANEEDLRLFKSYIQGEPWPWVFQMSIADMCRDQTFFVTQQGYMGIGSPLLKKGDEVWILYGGRSPFTLRKVQPKISSDNTGVLLPAYITLGDCYVHGIMNGEAMEGKEGKAEMMVLQ